jgi:hypothetical protein
MATPTVINHSQHRTSSRHPVTRLVTAEKKILFFSPPPNFSAAITSDHTLSGKY